MGKSGISTAVIKRLPRYYRYLGELMESGTERISSNELSKMMNVTASQIRQDLNNFGGFGQQGYGYNVKYLHTEIGKILGIDKSNHMVIIGAGNLGHALANIASVCDPTVFVIGGGVSKAGEILLKYLEKPFDEKLFFGNREIEFALATLGNDAGICGAAKLIIE